MIIKILRRDHKKYLIFSRETISNLIRQEFLRIVPEVMRILGINFEDLASDPPKMIEASGLASKKIFKGALASELFQAWHIFSNFYEDDAEIGIEIKDNVMEKGISARSFDDLKKITKADTLVDFIIISKSGTRLFQLKNYYGNTSTDDLWAYLEKTLIHYSKDLGDTNLLIVLSGGGDLSGVDFTTITDKLKIFGLKGDGWIMISFNENNDKIVINQIFPSLTRSEIPLILNYPELKDRYQPWSI